MERKKVILLMLGPLFADPNLQGGRGILNLGLQNEALLMKHLKKFYNKVDVPWVHLVWDSYYFERIPHDTTLCGSFWWRDISKLMDKFRAVTQVTINRGDTMLFWSDHWQIGNNCTPFQERFRRLFSYCLDKNLSVNEVVQNGNFH